MDINDCMSTQTKNTFDCDFMNDQYHIAYPNENDSISNNQTYYNHEEIQNNSIEEQLQCQVNDSIHPTTNNNRNDYDNQFKSHIYIEHPSTGQFSRYSLPLSTTSKLSDQQQCKDDEHISLELDERALHKHHSIARIQKALNVQFFMWQGIITGFAFHSLYDVFIQRNPSDFLFEYGRLANEIRRFYFLFSTFCVMLTIYLSDIDEWYKAMETKNFKSFFMNMKVFIMILYFIVLILVLVGGKKDAQISYTFHQNSDVTDILQLPQVEIQDEVEEKIYVWKILSTIRSICCIISWLLSNKMLYYGNNDKSNDCDIQLKTSNK